MRVLVTVRPQMYREALALALREHRPEAEVMLANPTSLGGEVAALGPHLLVRDDDDGATPEVLETVACRVDVQVTDGMGARIKLNGQVRRVEDMGVEDLLAVADEVEGLVSRGPAG